MSTRLALVIANTEYTDPGLAQLTAPGRDAEDLARVLRDSNLCAFNEVNVLLNEPEYVVRAKVDEFFDQKRPDDLLLLYFSGHGVRDELGALYLAVKNTNRLRLRSTALKSDFIREAMDQSRSKRQVLILDCCNSGAFGQGMKAATGVSIGTATAFEAGSGRIILTASDSTQFAWEGETVIGETDNSLFTHFLVKGLEGEADLDGDGNITVDELYDYAYENVKRATPRQTPSKFSSKQQGEIILRQITRLEDIKPASLPDELIEALEDSRTFVREGAVQQLEKLLRGKNLGLARSAREALEKIEREDDSRRVSQLATQALATVRQAEQLDLQKAEETRREAERAEAEQKQSEAAAQLGRKRAEEEQRAREQEEHRIRERQAAEARQAQLEAARLAEEKRRAEQIAQYAAAQRMEKETKSKSQLEDSTAKSVFARPGVLRWVLVGVVGLCVIATGAWAISYLGSALKPPATPYATEPPATELPVVVPVSSPTESLVTEAPTAALSSMPAVTEAPASRPCKILWDTSHGVYFNYQPSQSFSSLKSELEKQSCSIDENSAGVQNVDLSQYSGIVIASVSADTSSYTSSEVDSIYQFVQGGGGLVLIFDNPSVNGNKNIQAIANRFQIPGPSKEAAANVTNFASHPLTQSLGSLKLNYAGIIDTSQSTLQVIASDPSSNGIAAAGTIGSGRVVVVGDANLWDNENINSADNLRFARNVFLWVDQQ